jgi:hypothetical protein
MNYILHFVFTIQYNIGFRNKHSAYINPFPTIFFAGVMVLYNLKVFCSDMKFKMATTAGLNLTLDPMGKMFQNASSLKPLGQLKPK